jgi:hypothetical protein
VLDEAAHPGDRTQPVFAAVAGVSQCLCWPAADRRLRVCAYTPSTVIRTTKSLKSAGPTPSLQRSV